MVARQPYLHNGNPYTWKMVFVLKQGSGCFQRTHKKHTAATQSNLIMPRSNTRQ